MYENISYIRCRHIIDIQFYTLVLSTECMLFSPPNVGSRPCCSPTYITFQMKSWHIPSIRKFYLLPTPTFMCLLPDLLHLSSLLVNPTTIWYVIYDLYSLQSPRYLYTRTLHLPKISLYYSILRISIRIMLSNQFYGRDSITFYGRLPFSQSEKYRRKANFSTIRLVEWK